MIININKGIDNNSIGGIELGSNTKFLFENYNLKSIKLGNKKRCYQIDDLPIIVYLDMHGIVVSIAVTDGYKGTIDNKYSLGDSIAKLIKDPDWIYVDTLEGFISGKHDNILIYPSLEDPDIDELNSAVLIEECYVTSLNEWCFDSWKNNPRTINDQRILMQNIQQIYL